MVNFKQVKEDAKYVWNLGASPKAGLGILLLGSTVLLNQWYNAPALKHPHDLELLHAKRYKVDASAHGADGVRYRARPALNYTVGLPYPCNGTVLVGKETVQYPKWIMADNGYFLPLEIDGKECITAVPIPSKAA
eukprot:TRINITY_DN15593_c0_g1_i1.p1 TRINITY_DN15593_c0_g1~~TRINITY_DN15593_c0_g1_i1.p1  ORF type:complete len:135 (+),score=49.59 TRINITY_DN15593_c0_g1_i1:59-463(+)